jgi:hypothetical protein
VTASAAGTRILLERELEGFAAAGPSIDPMPVRHALVTPSFRTDFERCALLVETARRWASPDLSHYLVVDHRDVPLFRPLESGRTKVLVVEEIVPWWILRLPGVRRFWLSLRSRPMKNWILQQMVKLSMASVVPDDVLFFVDSDVFFCAPFDPTSLLRDGKPPLFVQRGQRGLIPRNDEWHQAAARLLGLPPEPWYDTNFIGNLICWRRETVLKLRDRIEEVSGKRWQLAIAPQWAFSEYILYGLFVTQALPDGGQWHDGVARTLCYWGTQPLDETRLRTLKEERADHHCTVMISAKSRTPVAAIRRVFSPDA